MKFFHKIVATFFGAGYSPIAPGTVGAIFACLVFLIFDALNIVIGNHLLFIFLIIVFILIGIYSTNQLINEWGKDPSKIVIDEVVGMWITILFVPFSYFNLFIGFILFRFFDITKPLGIRKLENLNKGLGVMADDLLAGIYANLVLQIIIYIK